MDDEKRAREVLREITGGEHTLIGRDEALEAMLAFNAPPDGEREGLRIKVEDAARSDWLQKSAEEISDIIRDAYLAGAMAVHTHWIENPGEAPRGDPEFGEAAYDYMMSVGPMVVAEDGSALSPHQGDREAIAREGFDAAVAAIRSWANGFFGGDTGPRLRAVATDLEQNRDCILSLPSPDR